MKKGQNMKGLKKAIAGIMEAAETNVKSQMRDDDYIDPEDGFIHCGKCKRSRQMRTNLFGVDQIVWCICNCRNEELKQEEERRIREKIELLKADGFNDPALAESVFDIDANPESENSIICRNYVKHFEQFYEKGKGLLMTGGVGTGKTFYASCIANALMDKLHPVLVTSIGRLVRGMEDEFGGRNERIDYLDRFALVVFDDLGVERNTPYMNEQIYAIIDGRIRSGKPMIVTTNVTLETIKQSGTIETDRIYDRILMKCIPLVFKEKNMRRAKIREEYANDMKLLRGEGGS